MNDCNDLGLRDFFVISIGSILKMAVGRRGRAPLSMLHFALRGG
jgi:hypothetical protein